MIVLVYLAFNSLLLVALSAAHSGDLAKLATDRIPPAALLALLFGFGGLVLAVLVVVRYWHKRRGETLFGQHCSSGFAAGVITVLAIYGPLTALSLWVDGAQPALSPMIWLRVLPLVLAGLALQTLAEELFFRGYLTQQLAARFRSPLIWALIPSLIFALSHFDPTTYGVPWPVQVGGAMVFALIATDLTYRTGSIGAAWGMHLANNLFAFAIVAADGPLAGLALFTVDFDPSNLSNSPWLVLQDLVPMILTWLILRFWAVRLQFAATLRI
ncbi:MAG: lysostaphin resistance A-like protein [Mangrovicoccus sp.]